MGHLGLTPQSVSSLGGFRLQGKSAKQAKKIVDDAKALEEPGVMAILLELVPDQVCALITERAKVPIISLGSGPNAHGQLLIFHDMFGLYPRFTPKMAKKYADAGKAIGDGLKQYVAEVTAKVFPEPEHYFGIKDEEYAELRRLRGAGRSERNRSWHTKDELRRTAAHPSRAAGRDQRLLLDPNARVVNDLLDVVARYGTPEEINAKAAEARELDNLLARLAEHDCRYLDDLTG